MERDYADQYSTLYRRHWWWRAREQFLLDHFRRLFPGGVGGSILDVGCGDGLFFDKLREFGQPEGVEADGHLVTEQGRRQGPIHIGSLETFPKDRSFRLILMADVVEHVEDDVALLRCARELLAADGHLVLTVPAFPALWTQHDDVNRHHRRYTLASFTSAVRQAGLQVEHARYFFHWLAPLKLLVAARERIRPPRGTAATMIPPGLINGLLTRLTRVEQRLLRDHAPPFGSSLLVVARRQEG